MSVSVDEFDVVVVGAGPGGLASAATLGSYGVDTLVVEQRTSPSELPRANAASTGTMELLRRWGLERRARERSLEVEFQAWASPTLATAGEGRAIDVGFPTRHQAGLISPTRPAAIGQDELEPLIEAHVRSLAGIGSSAASNSSRSSATTTPATSSPSPAPVSASAESTPDT